LDHSVPKIYLTRLLSMKVSQQTHIQTARR